jgi:hypothetical protein
VERLVVQLFECRVDPFTQRLQAFFERGKLFISRHRPRLPRDKTTRQRARGNAERATVTPGGVEGPGLGGRHHFIEIGARAVPWLGVTVSFVVIP